MTKKLPTVLAAACAAGAAYAVAETYALRRRSVTLSSSRLPAAFDGYRLVFLSDLHCHRLERKGYYRRVVSKVMAEKADLILLGGDYVRRDPDLEYDPECLYALLNPLCATDGVLGVAGNHDRACRGFTEAMFDYLGFKLLSNSSVRIRRGEESILIAGVDDMQKGGHDPEAAIAGGEGLFTVLLSHNPLIAGEMDGSKVDLQLSGHSHGIYPRIMRDASVFGGQYDKLYIHGVYDGDDISSRTVIVSSGIGTVRLPTRFGRSPEYWCVTLRRAEEKA